MSTNSNRYYAMTTPCAHCPFRTDITPYLRYNRVWEIANSLQRAHFPCHKTTVPSEDDDNLIEGPDSIHCAGALILLEKIEQPSQMMRIAERLGMYDASKLNMDAPVYDDFDEMAEAQGDAGDEEDEDCDEDDADY